MRVLPLLLIASAALTAAEDRWPMQGVVGIAGTGDSEMRKASGASVGLFAAAAARLPVESAAEPWVDVQFRSQHGNQVGSDLLTLQATARPVLIDPLYGVLGAGFAVGRTSTGGSTAWEVSPSITLGMGTVFEERWVIEGGFQLLPQDFNGIDLSAVVVGVGVRF